MAEYGICIWNIVPVRTRPSDREELCTQLLFGDMYEVLEFTTDKKWLKIKVSYDGYQGWIDAKQCFSISQDFYNKALKENTTSVVQELGSKALFAEKEIHLVPGSSLPFYEGTSFSIADMSWGFVGHAGMAFSDKIVNKAFKYLGTPYLWGGKTHFGIDCSGFVQMVFKQCGVRISRDAYQQAQEGVEVSLVTAKPVDLAFFANDTGKITHVGILLEGSKIIHAHGEVRVDRLDEQGIYNEDKKAYTHTFSHLRRL